ncbi:MAG: co-chaperone GroES family protein [Prolixibacteraceae bacterium]|jgi:co-chaperonin GroES (HSP10)|nr:co-chaperone GroES family protein [Prolixibacteraceae bacterium]
MALNLSEKDLAKIILVGDRVLVKPKNPNQQTSSGLYLPPTAVEKESVQSGYVIKTGPGFPIPAMTDDDEPWKEIKEEVKYVPLQAREGDLAVYLNKMGFDIEFKNEKYLILPHSAILMLVREEGLFE